MSKIGVTLGGYAFEVDINSSQRMDSEVTVQINGETIRAVVPETDLPIDQLGWIIVDGRPHEIVIDSELSWIKAGGGLHVLEVRDLEAPVTRPVSLDSRIKAPIPGVIKAVFVKLGDAVEAGQPLLVLEAMKMENEIHATKPGTVSQLAVMAGQKVTLNEVLVEIT